MPSWQLGPKLARRLAFEFSSPLKDGLRSLPDALSILYRATRVRGPLETLIFRSEQYSGIEKRNVDRAAAASQIHIWVSASQFFQNGARVVRDDFDASPVPSEI